MASFEQNSPLTEFQRIIGLRACEIVHLDLNYSGGVASVARSPATYTLRWVRIVGPASTRRLRRPGTLASRSAITSATVAFACRDAEDLAKILVMPYAFAPPDATQYHAWCERAGEQAMVMVGLADAICTPATLMSPEDLCYCWADDPEALTALTNIAHTRAMRHLEALCEQGVKAFRIIGGEYATTQLGPAGFEALCLRQDRELCELMRGYGAISYYHNHGAVMRYLELFRAVGMDAIDPFEGPPYGDADLAECRRALGDICIVGNLDDMEQYEKLSHARLRELAAERLQATGAKGRVLGGTASGTYTEVGARGFMALVEVAEEFGQG